jgi:hypothetical protein
MQALLDAASTAQRKVLSGVSSWCHGGLWSVPASRIAWLMAMEALGMCCGLGSFHSDMDVLSDHQANMQAASGKSSSLR